MVATPANIHAALVEAHKDLTNPPKNATANLGHGKPYKYSDLAEVLAHVRPVLAKHGLAVSQSLTHAEGRMCVTTTLHHVTGETLTFGPIEGPGTGKWQDLGSAATYARRYALCAALGIAGDEDDDGAHAQEAVESKPKPKAKASPEDVLRFYAGLTEAENVAALDKIAAHLATVGLEPDVAAELRELYGKRKAELA